MNSFGMDLRATKLKTTPPSPQKSGKLPSPAHARFDHRGVQAKAFRLECRWDDPNEKMPGNCHLDRPSFPAFRSSATNMLSYCERLNLRDDCWQLFWRTQLKFGQEQIL